MVVAECGGRHIDPVGRVILLRPPLYRDEAEARQRLGEMSRLAGLTVRSNGLARFLCLLHTAFLPVSARLASHLPSELPPTVLEDGVLHFWPSVHGSTENVVLRHPIEPAVALLGAKVTFVHGRRDAITSLDRVREVAG